MCTVNDLLYRQPVACSVFDLARCTQFELQRALVLNRVKPVSRKRHGCSNRDVDLRQLPAAQRRHARRLESLLLAGCSGSRL